jgi:hypothetical protein
MRTRTTTTIRQRKRSTTNLLPSLLLLLLVRNVLYLPKSITTRAPPALRILAHPCRTIGPLRTRARCTHMRTHTRTTRSSSTTALLRIRLPRFTHLLPAQALGVLHYIPMRRDLLHRLVRVRVPSLRALDILRRIRNEVTGLLLPLALLLTPVITLDLGQPKSITTIHLRGNPAFRRLIVTPIRRRIAAPIHPPIVTLIRRPIAPIGGRQADFVRRTTLSFRPCSVSFSCFLPLSE